MKAILEILIYFQLKLLSCAMLSFSNEETNVPLENIIFKIITNGVHFTFAIVFNLWEIKPIFHVISFHKITKIFIDISIGNQSRLSFRFIYLRLRVDRRNQIAKFEFPN